MRGSKPIEVTIKVPVIDSLYDDQLIEIARVTTLGIRHNF